MVGGSAGGAPLAGPQLNEVDALATALVAQQSGGGHDAQRQPEVLAAALRVVES
jgi:hypothetical protein